MQFNMFVNFNVKIYDIDVLLNCLLILNRLKNKH